MKDGKVVDYEEARLAALMASYMLQFADRSIVRLTKFSEVDQKTDLQSILAIKEYESRFKSKRLSPDVYLGNYHPDASGRQEERQRNYKIFNNILNRVMEDKE